MSVNDICMCLFKGYDNIFGINEFVELLDKYEDFKDAIISGINNGTLNGIDADVMEKFKKYYPNFENNYSLYDNIALGNNIGKSYTYSTLFSYFYKDALLYEGKNKYINKEDTLKHTWINVNGINIDTSLLIEFPDNMLESLGYKVENKLDFREDKLYELNKKEIIDALERK